MLDLTKKPGRPLVNASILSADFGNIAADCRNVLDLGADLLHIDVMDGHFVPNLTMGADMIKGLRRHLPDTFLDVHLMVERPDEYVDSFASAGANLFSFHLERCRPYQPDGVDGRELIQRIKDAGMLAGMVINPPTKPGGLERYFDVLDLVLVMSVNPGRSGQSFIEDVLPKTRWIAERIGRKTRLEMDGGLNPETSRLAVAAGVDTLVTASALFGAEDRKSVIDAMHQAGKTAD